MANRRYAASCAPHRPIAHTRRGRSLRARPEACESIVAFLVIGAARARARESQTATSALVALLIHPFATQWRETRSRVVAARRCRRRRRRCSRSTGQRSISRCCCCCYFLYYWPNCSASETTSQPARLRGPPIKALTELYQQRWSQRASASNARHSQQHDSCLIELRPA